MWSGLIHAPIAYSLRLGPVSGAPLGDVYVGHARSFGGDKSSSIAHYGPTGAFTESINVVDIGSGINPPTFVGTDPLGNLLYSYFQDAFNQVTTAAVKYPPGGAGSKSVAAYWLWTTLSQAYLHFGVQGGDSAGNWLMEASILSSQCSGGYEGCGIDFGNGVETGKRVLRYDAGGNYLGSIPSPGSFRVAPSGGLYVANGFEGTTDVGCGPVVGSGPSTVLAKLDIDGVCQWSKALFAPAPAAFTVGGDGSILLAFRHTGSIDLGGGPLPDFGAENLTIAGFDSGGDVTMTRTFGGAGSSFSEVTIDTVPSGSMLLASKFTGAVDLGAGPLSNSGDTLLAAFDPTWALRWSKVVNVGKVKYNYSDPLLQMTRQPCAMVVVTNSTTVDLGAGPVVAVPLSEYPADIAVVALSL